jgi:hypothetical protein
MDDLKRKLADAPRKLEIASQRALLKTAHAVKEAEVSAMQRVFDKPTRWTLGSIKVKPTAKMEVSVGILDPAGSYKRAANYVGTQVGGGHRRQKAMEKALQQRGVLPSGWMTVPGEGAKIDAYGNMSVGQIKQILSWFDSAEPSAGSTQNMGQAGRDKKRKGTRKNVGFEYIVVSPGRQRNLKQPGIYQRFFFGHGKAIKPVIIFVKSTKYSARFDFEKVARDTAAKVMRPEFDSAIAAELAR